MLSIEEALGNYADMINANKPIDLDHFKKALSAVDYKEFLDLTKFVKLTKAYKATQKFEKMFADMDQYKREYFADALPKAAGFKKDESVAVESHDNQNEAKEYDDDTMEKFNQMFKEEFGEDEHQ